MSTEAQEAQQLLEAAFAGKLDLDAVDSANVAVVAAAEPEAKEAEPAASAESEAGASSKSSGEEPEGAPIAAKSGNYTIPYEKLSEARNKAKTLEEENALLKAQVAELSAKQQDNLNAAQAEAAARASAGQAPTNADQQVSIAQAAIGQGVDPAIFGDFSEDAIAKGVKTLVDMQIRAHFDELNKQFDSRVDARAKELLAPLQQQQAQSIQDKHLAAIYAAHPDVESIADSKELSDWMAGQPSFVRGSIEDVFKNGTAQQVIEVLDSFKAATAKPAASDQDKAKAKVAEAMKSAAEATPASLSELAGGSVGVSDVERANALAGDPVKLMEFMSSLSPEKANRLMNSMV